jgi:hypothetical protein
MRGMFSKPIKRFLPAQSVRRHRAQRQVADEKSHGELRSIWRAASTTVASTQRSRSVRIASLSNIRTETGSSIHRVISNISSMPSHKRAASRISSSRIKTMWPMQRSMPHSSARNG